MIDAMPKLQSLMPKVTAAVNTHAPARIDTGWYGKHRASRKARGYGPEWDRQRLEILKRDNYICQCTRCKAEGIIRPANEVDHVVPKQEGGTDEDDNLQSINHDCHELKTQAEAARGVRRVFGRSESVDEG